MLVCMSTPGHQTSEEVECEFRHLSLAEYLTAIHVHTTGQPLKVLHTTCHHITCHFSPVTCQPVSLSACHPDTLSPCHLSPVQGFAKDRKELILQYLSGLASPK